MATISSPVWGNQTFNITNPFAYNSPNVPDDWYAYAAKWGYNYGDHIALDIGMPCGTPIYAIQAGTVKHAGFSNSYRPFPVHIVTDDGRYEHIYGHLQENTVRTGDPVRAGQLIGYSGEQTVRGTTTPDGSGCHLHFELLDLQQHVALDPTGLLTGSGVTPEGPGAQWPTAEAIDAYIAQVSSNNGRRSPLMGMGSTYLELGRKYGIHPGVAVAFMQRETQLGTDGSEAPRHYNFGWNKAIPGSVEGTAGTFWHAGTASHYQKNASARDGLEQWFRVLDQDIYRDTGGRLIDVMEVYAPTSDGNSHEDGLRIVAAVGEALGIPLNADTNVYGTGTSSGSSGSSGGGLVDLTPLLDALKDYGQRAGLGLAGLVGVGLGVMLLVGPSNMIPAGRIVNFAKKAAT